jgi:AraC family transcriptional regulator, transcriptional activator of the genes for pyochelin and ferripyochelin receptors
MKSVVEVSPEMVALVGLGRSPDCALPEDPVVFRIDAVTTGRHPLLSFDVVYDPNLDQDAELVLVVNAAACRRLFDLRPHGPATWHLPSGLTALALSIIDCDAEGEARTTLRLARSIELLCQIHAAFADQATLVSVEGEGTLSEIDVARVAAARQAIDQQWHDKLTIADLSRIAGMNRDKLARGFQSLYGATIAQVLSERRLSEARRLLLASDLPVATIAYRCSYLNNAAFSRAFNRRYGIAPSELRRTGIAA